LQIHVAGTSGSPITATLEVGGIPADCPSSASASVDL
jgi:hypothetical protein